MQYRIVHRPVDKDDRWALWSSKAYDSVEANRLLNNLRENNKFFRFHREYALQHRSFGEWEGP